jgi:hypothetical protein
MPTNMREVAKEAILGGFNNVVGHLYSEYFKMIVTAHGDDEKIKLANGQFKMGIKIANQAYTDCLNNSD